MPDPQQDELSSIDLDSVLDDAREDEAMTRAHTELTRAHRAVEVIPEVAESERVRSNLGKGMYHMGEALEEQARQAIQSWSNVSPQLAQKGQLLVQKMVEAGRKVERRELSPESGELAVKQYMHAVQLYGSAIDNKAKAEAYVRGLRLLETSKRVLFVLLRMGLEAALPTSGAALTALSLVAEESL